MRTQTRDFSMSLPAQYTMADWLIRALALIWLLYNIAITKWPVRTFWCSKCSGVDMKLVTRDSWLVRCDIRDSSPEEKKRSKKRSKIRMSLLSDKDLALNNQAGGLYGRILTEVVSTDRTQWCLYTRPRSRFAHTDRLSSVNKMFIIWKKTRTI